MQGTDLLSLPRFLKLPICFDIFLSTFISSSFSPEVPLPARILGHFPTSGESSRVNQHFPSSEGSAQHVSHLHIFHNSITQQKKLSKLIKPANIIGSFRTLPVQAESARVSIGPVSSVM